MPLTPQVNPGQRNPLRKRVESPVIGRIEARDRLEIIYSTATIGENDSEVSFFPRSPSAGNVESNYDSIPLPGDYAREVHGAALNLAVGSIRSTDLSNSDPDKILAELRNGILEITADADECLLLRTPLYRVMALDQATFESFRSYDGTTETVYHRVVIPPTGIQLFENPFRIGNGQVWDAVAKFADGSAFPSEANTEVKTLKARLELETVIKSGS